ncbi:MAG: acetyl-CoA C-acyltransferase, partial [Actinobacteria bacterium]|nr:acetyl-CoA C-acyltransferase [Actinomycetota bacterium]
MTTAVIVDYLRTPFSRSRPNKPERDAFNNLRMDEALSVIIRELISRNNVKPEEINDLLTGCGMQMR